MPDTLGMKISYINHFFKKEKPEIIWNVAGVAEIVKIHSGLCVLCTDKPSTEQLVLGGNESFIDLAKARGQESKSSQVYLPQKAKVGTFMQQGSREGGLWGNFGRSLFFQS